MQSKFLAFLPWKLLKGLNFLNTCFILSVLWWQHFRFAIDGLAHLRFEDLRICDSRTDHTKVADLRFRAGEAKNLICGFATAEWAENLRICDFQTNKRNCLPTFATHFLILRDRSGKGGDGFSTPSPMPFPSALKPYSPVSVMRELSGCTTGTRITTEEGVVGGGGGKDIYPSHNHDTITGPLPKPTRAEITTCRAPPQPTRAEITTCRHPSQQQGQK